jgi:DNA-binding protein Fis
VVTCDGDGIRLADFPYEASAQPDVEPKDVGNLARAEQNEILKALEQFGGNKTRAAEYLGINRKTLREKLRKYGLKYP